MQMPVFHPCLLYTISTDCVTVDSAEHMQVPAVETSGAQAGHSLQEMWERAYAPYLIVFPSNLLSQGE